MRAGRIDLRYGLPLLLLALTLVTIGYGVATVAPGAGRDYEQALLGFAGSERALSEEIYSLQIGAVGHFDRLKDAVQSLRSAEAPLGAVPRHVDSATAFNETRLQLSVMVNERLALVEAFKTNLATLQVGLDTLPDQIARAEPEAIEAGGDTQSLLARTAGSLARLAHERGEAAEGQLASELAALAAAAGEETSTAFKPGLAALARQGELIRARKKALDGVVLQIASIPLSARAIELVGLYRAADVKNRRQTAYALGGVTAVLAIGMAALFFAMLWRARGELAAAVAHQASLKEALKEARNQSVTLQRGEKEQTALLAEERHIALVQHAFDLMAVLSRQENYIHVSPASVAFFGLTEKEMIGKSVYEGIHADDIIKVQDYLARAQRELQTEQTIQYRVMDAYGKWHLLETFASNQASNPAVRGMVLNTRRLGAAPDPRVR